MTHSAEFDEYRARATQGGIIPVVRELSADTLTPVSALAAVSRPPFAFLLESLVGGERWARYSFLGTEPCEAWRYRNGAVEHWAPARGWRPAGRMADPVAHLSERLRRLTPVAPEGLPRFIGGAVGFLSYDAARAFERLPGGPDDDLGLPDALFMIVDTLVIIDNAFARAIVVANTYVPPGASVRMLRAEFGRAERRIQAVLDRLHTPASLRPLSLDGGRPLRVNSRYPRAGFEAGVRRIKEYIRAGDAYQVVLSRRQDLPCRADPLQVYRCLRALNPAPYLYYLALDGTHVVGSSPEVLVRVEDDEVTVRPIAGTRARGATPDEDAALASELLADAKELAEHAMLVDLGRNDVGRVAEFGTVRLTEDKTIERYSHVQHIVSEVRGRLRNGLDAVDALRACFPAGTVSGAPKIRAMEIVDELEPTRRGPYAGAVGYLGWGGNVLDAAITIRTAILRHGRAHVQAGAGIVADSDPAREFQETEDKAGAVLRALELAEGQRVRRLDG